MQAGVELVMMDGSRVDASSTKCNLTWTSSDAGIVSVSATGMLEPIAPGTAEITVTCSPIEGSASAPVTIRKTYAFTGRLVEAESGAPLSGATVTVTSGEDAGLVVQTDQTGAFLLSMLVDQEVNITATAEGYSVAHTRAQNGVPLVIHLLSSWYYMMP